MKLIKYLITTSITTSALLFIGSFSYASNCSQLFGAQKYSSALQQCKAEAWQSSSGASYILGQMYEKGLGVKADPQKAINYYQQALLANDLDSQIALGLFHKNNQNYLLSHVYLTLATENGSLGACHEKEKVEKNLSKDELLLSRDYLGIIKTAIAQYQRTLAIN